MAEIKSNALHDCVLAGNTKLVSSLIEEGADVNARDRNGDTPLHLASRSAEKMEIVSLLIEGGANINAQDEDGDTPLHDALFLLGDRKLASFLIEKGADASIKNKNGQAPFHFNSFEKFASREAERIRSREKEKQEAISQIRKKFEHNFAEADSFYEEELADLLPRNDYEKQKIRFVQGWISQKTSMHPDDDQARAIGEIHGNIQLVARAGSGKTSTVINRALFLVEHCNIHPEELLLLAFNRKAVLEMRRRFLFIQHKDAETEFESQKRKKLADPKKQKNVAKHQQQDFEENIIDAVAEKLGIGLPHIMTFHALAHAIVKPAETLIYDDPQNNIFALSGSLQEVIVEHIHGELESEIRELMLAHMRNIDWGKTMEEFLQYRRSLSCQTLNGEKVKSEGEKLIADFLFEHDISYKYKPWCKGVRGWRPDFTIPKGRRECVIIQHIGLGSGDKYQQKHNWETIELSPHFLSEGAESFKEILKKALEEKGLKCAKLPEEEIWLRIKKRAIDRFTEATKNFVNRCRQLSWTPVDLENRISKYIKTVTDDSKSSLIEKQFLQIMQCVYLDYLERLSTTNEEDFNGLMQRAVNKINTGHAEFTRRDSKCDLRTIKYMFIDEFQDFSELFYKLVSAIRKLNQKIELFCVGDDWQAINGFAGSDLIFFKNFDRHFGNAKRLHMTTNYRSQRSIVKAGNILMSDLGKPATSNKTTAGILAVAYLDNFERSPVEDFHNDFITPAVLRLAQQFLKGNQDIVLLSRINHVAEHKGKNEEETGDETVRGIGIENFEKLIRSYLPEELRERISVSTVHKYKGLERKTVIILDAIENHYPLIHPDWIFTKVFGEDLESIILAERRLFYVAMTRAVDQLIIITRATEISPFFEELISSRHVPYSIRWDRIPPLTDGEASDKYLVKISNMKERGSEPTYNIKKELKESYYKWKGDEKYWWKTFPIESFNIETIKSNTWARKADGILVQIFDGTDTNCLASYTVESNRWECEFDNLEASDSKEGNTAVSILN
ncbi:MAG: UvrD-helicase domain-containing protein [Candidatus Dadabacteria bacterium]|nr:UvrD-helicase domain-containing protein [Candidatus Dadabacteria bacterium]MDE0662572.1 UvrD-helicase domain-containing protein [Candidatus Dadabacteria bacterium]